MNTGRHGTRLKKTAWDADASAILTLLMLRASKEAASISGLMSPVGGRRLSSRYSSYFFLLKEIISAVRLLLIFQHEKETVGSVLISLLRCTIFPAWMAAFWLMKGLYITVDGVVSNYVHMLG